MRTWMMVVALGLAACGGDDDGDSAAQADASPGADAAGADGGGSQTLTLTSYVGGEKAPFRWAAAQDGDGPWQAITSPDGIYQIELDSSRFGIVYVCEFGATFRSLHFFTGTLAEVTELTRACPATTAPALGELQLQVTGLDADDSASVFMGTGSAGATMAADTVVMNLIPSQWDFAVTYRPAGSGTDITRAAIVTDTITADQTTSVTVDAVNDTVAVESHTVSISGEGSESAVFTGGLLSARGTSTNMTQSSGNSYAALPMDEIGSRDYHRATATVVLGDIVRSVTTYVNIGQPLALELPAAGTFDPQLTAMVSGSHLSPTVTFDAWSGAQAYALSARQGFEEPTRELSWTTTAGWLEQASSIEWTQPDLSEAAGWNESWAFETGKQVFWNLYAARTNGSEFVIDYFEYDQATFRLIPGSWNGTTLWSAYKSDVFSPE